VHLVEDITMECAVERSICYAERNIPFCILPNPGESIGAEAALAPVLLYQTLLLGRANPGSTLVVLVAGPPSKAELELVRWLRSSVSSAALISAARAHRATR
jgi:hypothetical protein